MSEADWTLLDDGLDAYSIRQGVTTGIARPNGGGNFVYAFNSVVTTPGAAGRFLNQTDFAPMAKGMSVRAAVKRGASGGPMNFAPMLFACASMHSVNTVAYLLGPDDDDPHQIVLRKGTIVTGLPSVSVGTNGVLARSIETFLNDTWLHLRLDVIVNSNGDVILQCFRSDLAAHPVSNPVWTPLPGCEQFIDDAHGINNNAGTLPLTSGYAGFAFQSKDVTRRAFFDHVEVQRQL